jgi:hypothetical protein
MAGDWRCISTSTNTDRGIERGVGVEWREGKREGQWGRPVRCAAVVPQVGGAGGSAVRCK